MKKLLFSAVLLAGLAVLIAPPIAFAQEEKPFTLHGEVRTRLEYTDNVTDFTKSGTDPGIGSDDDQTNYWPYRVRIAAEGHFTKNITAWIEFQNAGVFGGDLFGPTKTGQGGLGFATTSGVELYQGNITLNKLWSDHFSLTIGRQELVKGNELQLGDLDFYSGLSHDGVVANWDLKKVQITGWYTRPFEGSVTHVDNFLAPDQVVVAANPATTDFWGAYVTWDIHKEMPLELYFMEQRNRGNGASAIPVLDSPTTVDMVGARFSHNNTTKSGAVWNAEYAQEFGKISDLSTPAVFEPGAKISGSVAEAMFGWNFKVKKIVHQVFGKYEFASGNKSETGPLDSKDEGFHPFYTDFHNRLGRGDWFHLTGAFPTALGSAIGAPLGAGGGGIQAWSVGYQGWTERHGWGAAYWDYSLDQKEDFGAAGTETKLGTAIDAWYDFNYSKNLTFEASFSQLTPDNALTGDAPGAPNDPVRRIYGNARLRF